MSWKIDNSGFRNEQDIDIGVLKRCNAIQNKKGKSRSTFSGFQVKILMEIKYFFRIRGTVLHH